MLRVIHPNRWFLWANAAILAVAAFLLINIQRASVEFEDNALAGTFSAHWKTYKSEALGISVRYPPSWQIELDPDDAKTFFLGKTGNYNENISISVREPSLEPVIRQALRIASEKPVEIGGVKGSWIMGQERQDSATGNVILLKQNDQLYYIAGSGRDFEKIVMGIKFLKHE